jgi:tRNA threonylcarbamoyladenosine biosynthesis protein TsaE
MAILDQWTIDFVSRNVEQTERLGVRLGELLTPGDMICLQGDLGAGKTAMARGIGRGWGTAVRVTSPTFTLINEYPRMGDGRILYHLDCYRLESDEAAITVGFEELLDGSEAMMIEWPERIQSFLPGDALWIALRYQSETRRKMRITAHGARATALFSRFKKEAFGV